ncbi:hypothetical protein GZ78_05565 [Endozoicomonas numazuensis]|uniref:Uncharacterized protein n=1 Tax=Endozoicomonas numazuensis TaxID=1137799 RepID=A0A081NLU5_9GAMM|nr:hypothetical protein GZ78_05565 [Endozoicomonas numazuensis]
MEQVYTATAQWCMNTADYAQKKTLPAATRAAIENGLMQVGQYLESINSLRLPPNAIHKALRLITSRNERREVA